MTEAVILFEPLSIRITRETNHRLKLDEEARQLDYQYAPESETRLSVLITARGHFVTGVWTELDQGELYEFVDDTGKDLLCDGGGSGSTGVSPDSCVGLFDICGRTSPHANAREIYARGLIRISTAEATVIDKSDVVTVRKGSMASVAGFEFNIGEVKQSDYGDGELEVKLLRSAKEHQLRNVRSSLL